VAALTLEGATVTASGNGSIGAYIGNAGRQFLDATVLDVQLNVTAVTGTTPSLTVEVQWSSDGVTYASAETPDVFAAITAAKAVVKQFAAKGEFARLKYTVTGTTPSFRVDAFGETA
jgi:hypothetical protein